MWYILFFPRQQHRVCMSFLNPVLASHESYLGVCSWSLESQICCHKLEVGKWGNILSHTCMDFVRYSRWSVKLCTIKRIQRCLRRGIPPRGDSWGVPDLPRHVGGATFPLQNAMFILHSTEGIKGSTTSFIPGKVYWKYSSKLGSINKNLELNWKKCRFAKGKSSWSEHHNFHQGIFPGSKKCWWNSELSG